MSASCLYASAVQPPKRIGNKDYSRQDAFDVSPFIINDYSIDVFEGYILPYLDVETSDWDEVCEGVIRVTVWRSAAARAAQLELC